MKTLYEYSNQNRKAYALKAAEANLNGQLLSVDDNRNLVFRAKEPSKEQLSDDIRKQRNIKLAQSDWTQMPDAPLSDTDKEKWRFYRQALRDLPNQTDFPNAPFPEMP